MVHRGWSQGCHRCRAQHVRCDQRRPACKKCSSVKVVCPGYQDDGEGFLFKDQTKEVVHKNKSGRKGKPRNAAAVSDHSYHPLMTSATIPPIPEESHEDSSIHFFFGSFLRLNTSRSLECGLYPTLFPIYYQSPPDSPLRLAVTVSAGEIAALSFRTGHSLRHVWNVSRAIQAITLALQDPKQRSQDATLLAILILQKAEQTYCVRHGGTSISTVHENGAMALVRWRGSENVPDYLLAGVRSSILTSLVYGGASTATAAETLAYLEAVENERQSPTVVSLDQLLARALCLWQRACTISTSEAEAVKGLQCELYNLEDSLVFWLYRTSPSLLPTHCIPDPWVTDHAESYVTPEAAFLFQQWRLTRSVTLTVSRDLARRVKSKDGAARGGEESMNVAGNSRNQVEGASSGSMSAASESKDEKAGSAGDGDVHPVEDLLENILFATTYFFDLLKERATSARLATAGGVDPVPMGAICLHLTLRLVMWYVEKFGSGTDSRILGEIRKRDGELRGLLDRKNKAA